MKEWLQNKAMLEEDGAEVVEIVFALVVAVICGAALVGIGSLVAGAMNNGVQDSLTDAMEDAGIDYEDDDGEDE